MAQGYSLVSFVFLSALPMEQNEMQECGTGGAACVQVLVEATAVRAGESHQMTAVRALLWTEVVPRGNIARGPREPGDAAGAHRGHRQGTPP